MKRFALTGAAGFIAPRHMQAIKEVGGDLLCALDPSDSVGQMDTYFPQTHFFTEFERFDRHIEKLRRDKTPIDYLSICSPNHIHDAHIRYALRVGVDAICEKPLVLNPWNLDALKDIEESTGQTINTILQLRLHPTAQKIRQLKSGRAQKAEIDLTYVTPRGLWYFVSWKGDESKSGGLVTNIGIHFFDLLIDLFGKVEKSEVYLKEKNKISGFLDLKNAVVRWFLSIDPADAEQGKICRSLSINGEEFDLTQGFAELHTVSYREILNGHGFKIDDVRPSIELVSQIRQAPVVKNKFEKHPLLKVV